MVKGRMGQEASSSRAVRKQSASRADSHHVHQSALSCGVDSQGLIIQALGVVQLATELGQTAPLQQHRVRVGGERDGLGYAELGLL
ncbi:hypothetical protein EYF80_023279 [Liparis tanakae]|uniref:Uncharacterized protein n=1 Tax=Liparis tanakae TaxID=230148 RepID=A0A4Z2HL11_9TELE|nr:hypothetical protein EYF80_023279 [Liparis tanakae]